MVSLKRLCLLQFDWFITALEFITLLSMLGYLLARRSTPGIVALKAVVTVLEILRTNGRSHMTALAPF